jgi:hypothetical protein
LASHLTALVPKRAINQRTVAQGLENRRWVTDIKGALTVTIMEVGAEEIVLHPDVQDQHTWKLTSSGTYTWKSAKQTIFFLWALFVLPFGKGFGNLGFHCAANFSCGWLF